MGRFVSISLLVFYLLTTLAEAQFASVTVYLYVDGDSGEKATCEQPLYEVKNIKKGACYKTNETLSFEVDIFDKSSCLLKVWKNSSDCSTGGSGVQVPVGLATECMSVEGTYHGLVISCAAVPGDEKESRLASLSVDVGGGCALDPPFNPNIYYYSCRTTDYSFPFVDINAEPMSTAATCNVQSSGDAGLNFSCAGEPYINLADSGHSVTAEINVGSLTDTRYQSQYTIDITRAISPTCQKKCDNCNRKLEFYSDKNEEFSSIGNCASDYCLKLEYYKYVSDSHVTVYVSDGKKGIPAILVDSECGEASPTFSYPSGTYYFKYHCHNTFYNCNMNYELRFTCVYCG